MPPFNAERRDLLADAAIELLAREGARGLTHRAVDAAAAVPPGTTSRYFRTRDALIEAVVWRARALHFADLDRSQPGVLSLDDVVTHLTTIIRHAITTHRSRHLAMAELFLDSTRRPELRDLLVQTKATQLDLVRKLHAAAGIELTDRQSAGLSAALTGLLFIAITTPEVLGPRGIDELDDLVRDAARAAIDRSA